MRSVFTVRNLVPSPPENKLPEKLPKPGSICAEKNEPNLYRTERLRKQPNFSEKALNRIWLKTR